jgi:hypothetical protein
VLEGMTMSRRAGRSPASSPVIISLGLAGLLTASDASIARARAAAQQPVNPNAKTIAEFSKRVDEYVGLKKKLQDQLPHLPKEATPQQIDQHERGLAKLIQEARATAKPGDIFGPDMRQLTRHLLAQVFRGPGGRQIKKSIFDEPSAAKAPISVNGRYPDTVPLSTVPPQVLQNLPTLPDDLEYRFVGDSLILLDPHSHTIADYIEHVFP